MSWKESLLQMLRDDVGRGDITSKAIFPKGFRVKGAAIAGEPGIASGLMEAKWLFEQRGLKVSLKAEDGKSFRRGAALLEVSGDAIRLFEAERTALNIIGRMSGIATGTAEAAAIVRRAGGKAKIAATRKTVLRWFDKKAVVAGGGFPHRLGLYDAILVKTSHVRLAGGVCEALQRVRRNAPGKRIEVEVCDAGEAIEAAQCGAGTIMLDNFPHSEIARAFKILNAAGLRSKVRVELSGGITMRNLGRYAKYGADLISMGSLTHSPKWLQVSMRTKAL